MKDDSGEEVYQPFAPADLPPPTVVAGSSAGWVVWGNSFDDNALAEPNFVARATDVPGGFHAVVKLYWQNEFDRSPVVIARNRFRRNAATTDAALATVLAMVPSLPEWWTDDDRRHRRRREMNQHEPLFLPPSPVLLVVERNWFEGNEHFWGAARLNFNSGVLPATSLVADSGLADLVSASGSLYRIRFNSFDDPRLPCTYLFVIVLVLWRFARGRGWGGAVRTGNGSDSRSSPSCKRSRAGARDAAFQLISGRNTTTVAACSTRGRPKLLGKHAGRRGASPPAKLPYHAGADSR